MSINAMKNKLIILSPIVIPFSTVPMFAIGSQAHITIFRAYFFLIIGFFLLDIAVKGRIIISSNIALKAFSFLVVYAFLLLCSIFWSDDSVRSTLYSSYYVFYLSFVFVFISSNLSQKDINVFYNLWLLTSIVVGLMCFFEIYFGHRFPGSRYFDAERVSLAPTASFHNENNLAVYLAVTSLFFYAKLHDVNFLLKIIINLVLLYFLFIVVITESRGSLLIFAFGFCIYLFFSGKISWTIVLLKFALMLVIFIGLLFFIPDKLFLAIDEGVSVIENDARVILLKNAFTAMSENNFFGVGAGGIESYNARLGNVEVENTHNWFGEVVANTGIIGGFIWISAFTFVFFASLHVFKYGDVYFKACFFVFLLFPFWQSIVSSMIQFSMFWIFLSVFLKQIDLEFYRQASQKNCRFVRVM